MEIAAIVLGIVAIIAIAGTGASSSDSGAPGPPMAASGVTAGTSGPALQALIEQPTSTAGQQGSGSMSPTGKLPPIASAPIQFAPRPPARVPINIAPVQRVRFSAGAYPSTAPTVGFNQHNTAITGPGVAPRPRVTFSTT